MLFYSSCLIERQRYEHILVKSATFNLEEKVHFFLLFVVWGLYTMKIKLGKEEIFIIILRQKEGYYAYFLSENLEPRAFYIF